MESTESLVRIVATWLPRLARRAYQAVMVIAGLAGLAGVGAMVLALTAWHDSPVSIALVLALTAPAALVPLLTSRRIRPLTTAATAPEETARQAQQYFSRVVSTVELTELAERLTTVHRQRNRIRLRGVLRTSHMVGAVLDRVHPDPRSQPLLAAFTPANLRRIWLGVIASCWLWLLSLVIAIIASFKLVLEILAG